MTSLGTIVIVGAGLAAAAAAETLRAEGFDGRIVMIGDEAQPALRAAAPDQGLPPGRVGFEAAVVHPRSWYDEQRIELMLADRRHGLDPASRSVELDDGSTVGFDRLLLATGSDPGPWMSAAATSMAFTSCGRGSHADAIRGGISPARQVVVVGGGWIASEVAASARQLGAGVTMVSPSTVPLEKVLGLEVGTVYRDLHLEHGVRIVAGRRVVGFDGETAVERVALDDGTTIEADLVVVGVGATPRIELASRAGLAVGDGVVVDSASRDRRPWHLRSRRHRGGLAPHLRVAHPCRALGQRSSPGPRGGPQHARHGANRTSGSRTCTRTSSTSGWSTRATHRPGIGSSSAATRRRGSSWRSGSTATASWPG